MTQIGKPIKEIEVSPAEEPVPREVEVDEPAKVEETSPIADPVPVGG